MVTHSCCSSDAHLGKVIRLRPNSRASIEYPPGPLKASAMQVPTVTAEMKMELPLETMQTPTVPMAARQDEAVVRNPARRRIANSAPKSGRNVSRPFLSSRSIVAMISEAADARSDKRPTPARPRGKLIMLIA